MKHPNDFTSLGRRYYRCNNLFVANKTIKNKHKKKKNKHKALKCDTPINRKFHSRIDTFIASVIFLFQ